ncbi:U30 [Human betaherpesvirus 6B]|uniref:Inner tegument protein n=6 Tax=root TaxID=1 RepID=ITP_HHV6Z|nr:capsid assembly protein [Human betaherpesvirus 6B]Q9QJ38.1 RecName: Full=Inner tegument protein [Human herpesvirus 6 strain Z29]pir/T44177/ hypothetical protein U30 [imported] - human herpesvirus 6 (strain Z29) [Human betaherpesvirus 6]AAD49644.1 U30 [Human betaherpesvirus 6B]ARJ99831.1 U30 [Human betaherpesvirus 6]ARK01456.1 hypothetical protein [Human betaherpesvirus 6]ARK01702.1 hypothetical protein [Human betaherpesvirus 6]ARK02300.2 hypothetical protein [Human betaherpesvirus 6]
MTHDNRQLLPQETKLVTPNKDTLSSRYLHVLIIDNTLSTIEFVYMVVKAVLTQADTLKAFEQRKNRPTNRILGLSTSVSKRYINIPKFSSSGANNSQGVKTLAAIRKFSLPDKNCFRNFLSFSTTLFKVPASIDIYFLFFTASTVSTMAARALDLEFILSSLKNSTSPESLLAATAKIEILSLAADSVTHNRVIAFINRLPPKKYHFDLIREYTVFYFLNSTTLTSENKLLSAELLHEELSQIRSSSSPGTELENLNNAEVLYVFDRILNSIKMLKNELSSPIGKLRVQPAANDPGTDKTIKYSKIQSIIQKVHSFTRENSLLANCRAVVELIDDLYRKLYSWFLHILTFEDIQFPGDTFLDRLLKMDYCFTYYPSSNRHLIDLFEKTLDNQTSTDIDKFFDTSGNSPELLYQKTFSLKIFSKNLTAQDNGLYIYPLLKTDLSILDFLGTENILFHRGLIYHILHQKTIPQERENDLNKINQFFATVIQQVIETRSSCLPASLSRLLDTIFHFNRIGLNIETCRIYVEILSNHMATPDTQPIINTFTINLIHIVFTAHVFFICMENFSPTFLFYNRKKLILEQQRAILIIERNEYSTLWKQISDHIDCLFNISLSESFFKEYTKGGNEEHKQFLYKNLFEKWGDVFFPFTYSVTTSKNSTAHHITTLELRAICKEVYQSDSPEAYESLLPYSTHPAFKTLFIKIYVIPMVTYITNLTFDKLQSDYRLITLIHACKLLLPSQHLLLHYMVWLYAFSINVDHIDLGTFTVIKSVIFKIADHINVMTHTIYSPETNLLVSILLNAYTDYLQKYVNPWIKQTITANFSLLQTYITFTKQCASILATKCNINLDNLFISMTIGTDKIVTTSFCSFIATCRNLVRQHEEFKKSLKTIETSKTTLTNMLLNIITSVSSSKELLTNEALQKFIDTVQRISQHVNETYQLISVNLEKCKISNDILIESLKKTISIVDVLSSDAILNTSLTSRCLEAATLAVSNNSFTILEIKKDAVAVFKPFITQLFESMKPTTSLYKKLMATQKLTTDRIPFLDIFDDRYNLVRHVERQLNWYAAYAEAAQQDLIAPLTF